MYISTIIARDHVSKSSEKNFKNRSHITQSIFWQFLPPPGPPGTPAPPPSSTVIKTQPPPNYLIKVAPPPRDLRRQASPLQLELRSGSSRYRRYLDQKCPSPKFFKVFLKTTFLHDSYYPVHYKPNFFIGKNENVDYKINENCPIGITKIGRK